MSQSERAGQDGIREQQRRWREELPRLRDIVECVSPALLAAVGAPDHIYRGPKEWSELVAAMRQEVLTKADADEASDDETIDERRGYEWCWKIRDVAHMLDHLLHTIRQDLGFEGSATLASMVLVQRAMFQLQLELQEGGTKDGRGDGLEHQYRVQQALQALSRRFDDVQLRRLRALQHATSSARYAEIPDPETVERRVEEMSALEERSDEDSKQRTKEWFRDTMPALGGVMARSWLVEVDERFASLDPLIVLEEFAQAEPEEEGGRTEGGDGRIGPVRALARLAVRCGALGYAQREGEDFDTAVERARNNLLVTRSRIRKEVRSFPGRMEE
jgi:hypothetical protein